MATQVQHQHCKASDILTIGEDAPAELIAALDAYFSAFAKPIRDDSGKLCCAGCNQPLDGMMHALGAGVAAVWGLAHGEAHCSGCHWPMRGMHYPKDETGEGEPVLSLRNFFLSYHPDFAERQGS